MTNDPEKNGEGFAGRWSRRKTAMRDGEAVEIEEAPSEVPAEIPEEQINDGRDMPIPDDLPDIESLDKDSDYSLFMRDSTPQYLKRLALRKLWNSDPALAVLDGLNDYDEDYSMIGMVAQEITTRYQAGKGMVDPDEEKEKVETPEEIAEDVEEIEEEIEDVEEMPDEESPEDETDPDTPV